MTEASGFSSEDPFENLRRLAEQLNKALQPQLEQYRHLFGAADNLNKQLAGVLEPYRQVTESMQALVNQVTGPLGSMHHRTGNQRLLVALPNPSHIGNGKAPPLAHTQPPSLRPSSRTGFPLHQETQHAS